jgi:hypothetical protein
MVRGADFVRSSARDSVEGEIARAQAIAIEAEVRLSELARQPAESLIDAYRQQQGLDLLGEPVWSRDANTVAVCTVDNVPYVGINSQALTYTNADRSAAEQLRDVIVSCRSHVPVESCKSKWWELEGRVIEMSVDRVMCPSCRTVLPSIGLELGNPTVRFVDPGGSVRIMRDGTWK